MSDRNLMLQWIQRAYVVATPLFVLMCMVSKPFELYGIKGYTSALLGPMVAWVFFMLSERYPHGVRQLASTYVWLRFGVYMCVAFIAILPLGEGSIVGKELWEKVMLGNSVDRQVGAGSVLLLLIGSPAFFLHTRVRKGKKKRWCYAGIDLWLRGILLYGIIGGAYLWSGKEKEAYYFLSSIFWFGVSTCVSVLCGLVVMSTEAWKASEEGWSREPLQGDEWQYGRFLAFFIGVLLLTNVVMVRYVQLGPWVVTAGLLVYPFSFLMTDLISELYGRKYAEQTVVAGLVASVWMGLWTWVLVTLSGDAELDGAFRYFFSFAPGIVLGSMVAYLIGQWLDVQLFHGLKQATGGRYLWLRNNVGTIISQLVDTVVFGVVVWELWPRLGMSTAVEGETWSRLVLHESVGKVLMALLDTPLLYFLLYVVRGAKNKRVGKSC